MTLGTPFSKLAPFVLLLALVIACAPDQSGLFRDLSLGDALALARKEQKVVMIDFFATWCGPCKKLDQVTWKDPKVAEWAAQKCIALKVDAEKEVELAKRYSVAAYPTILLLNADGSEIDRIVGYRDGPQFIAETERVLARKGGDSRNE